jgi:hypothetical protein
MNGSPGGLQGPPKLGIIIISFGIGMQNRVSNEEGCVVQRRRFVKEKKSSCVTLGAFF